MRATSWCRIALVGLAVLAWMPAAASGDLPLALSAGDEAADACLDYTPVEESELEPAPLLGVEGEAVAPRPKPCKGAAACPDQPWCECTYNGAPRISCDPCCYQAYYGVICTS